jgi:tetratricopeptide (TPR) repeat protein
MTRSALRFPVLICAWALIAMLVASCGRLTQPPDPPAVVKKQNTSQPIVKPEQPDLPRTDTDIPKVPLDSPKVSPDVPKVQPDLPKTQPDVPRPSADFAALLKQGREARQAKKYAEAIRAFEMALQLTPGDALATRELTEVREILNADSEEKKKLAAYLERLNAGQAALKAQRYPDAIQNFQGALQLIPADPAATAALRDTNYAQNMAQGRQAVRDKKYADAVKAFEAALVVVPGDNAAQTELRQAQAALSAPTAEFNKYMKDGNALVQQKKYGEAVKTFELALKIKPDDATATTALQQARTAMAELSAKQAGYEKSMNEGQAALKARRFVDAVKGFEQALKDKPGDAAAQAALRQAQSGANDQAAYEKYMKDGEAALKAKKYPDAVRFFEAALKANPGDKAAADDLKKARDAKK